MSDPDFVVDNEEVMGPSDDEIKDDDFAPETSFGPKPWKDLPLTHAHLTKVVRKWVAKDWKLRPGQFEVVKALRPSGRVFCGFPTAAGKTLICCANALLDFVAGVAGVHIICQPLQALVSQTAGKLQDQYFARTRIQVIVWDNVARDAVADVDFMERVTVILASPEELDGVFLACGKHHARIRALMIDEAHLRDEWPFRNYLASDRFTSAYPHAMVGIFSATMEKSTVEGLKGAMGLFGSVEFDRDSVPALRALETQRLKQLVIRTCALSDLNQRILAAVAALGPKDSIVVFASTYDVLSSNYDRLFSPAIAHLKPRAYAAAFDRKVRDAVVKEFDAGVCRLVIATCAFGTGIDFPNIRYVFFDRAPRTWSSFMQHAGRAGRGDFTKEVFVTVASSPVDLKLSDRRVQVLAFYCPKAKSGKSAAKSKIKCSDCENERPRPPSKVFEFSGLCFDFEGVACNTTRQACLRTIAGFYQGLLGKDDLVNRALDCGKCSACSRKEADQVHFVVGNEVQVKASHNKHAGFRGIVVQVQGRVALRRGDGVQHAMAAASLHLVDARVQPVPMQIVKNQLSKAQRDVFVHLIRAELVRRDLEAGSFFRANAASEDEIQEAAKQKRHPILEAQKFKELLELAQSDSEVRFDHIKGFKAFLGRHEEGMGAAAGEERKRARKSIEFRKK